MNSCEYPMSGYELEYCNIFIGDMTGGTIRGHFIVDILGECTIWYVVHVEGVASIHHFRWVSTYFSILSDYLVATYRLPQRFKLCVLINTDYLSTSRLFAWQKMSYCLTICGQTYRQAFFRVLENLINFAFDSQLSSP